MPFAKMMRRTPQLALAAVLALGLPLAGRCAPPSQTHPWRVGVGGDLPTGFLGALAMYGLPHEAILDSEMTSAQALSKFQVIMLSQPAAPPSKVEAAVEEYVRNGGIAVYEEPCLPSQAFIPGKRLGPVKKGPTCIYERDNPYTVDLSDVPLHTGRAGGPIEYSILPKDPSALILARFTNHLADPKTPDRLMQGDIGAPATIVVNCGKGKVCWSGYRLSLMAEMEQARLVAPLIADLMRGLSDGQMRARFTTTPIPRDALLSQPHPYVDNPAELAPKESAAKPGKADVLEEDPSSAGEYDLYGTIKPGTDATAYLAYVNPHWYRAVRFAKGTASMVTMAGGKLTTLRSAPLPGGKKPMDLLIKRRWDAVTVYVNDAPLVSACCGEPLKGIVAAEGIDDDGYQPVAPVVFTDDFMRTGDEHGLWQTQSGKWDMVRGEGQPSMAANLYRYEGVGTGAPAIATAGSWFWDNYAMTMSVLSNATACGIVAHAQKLDRYILLRLETPANGKGSLSIIDHTPAGNTTLASVPVEADRWRWYKLGLRVTSGRIVASMDGRQMLTAPDKELGQGAVGMYVEGGHGQFDDVAVSPCHGLASPAAGYGPWDWVVQGGNWGHDSAGDASGSLSAKSSRTADALTVDDDYADGHYEAEVRAGPDSEAGLLTRSEGKAGAVFADLVRTHSGASVVLRETIDGHDKTLASAQVAGDAGAWHRLALDDVGHRFEVSVDGKPALHAYAPAEEHGALGLQVKGTAYFRGWYFMPEPSGEHVNDTPMPYYAGAIDRNSWAGRAGAWRADPAALDTFWHMGNFPGEVNARLGIYRDAPKVTTTRILLSPDYTPGHGYVLTATHGWGEPKVDLQLSRDGKYVARGQVSIDAKAGKFCLALRREGSLLTAAVNDRDGLFFEDANPVASPDLGFQSDGSGLLHPDDTRVSSTNLRNYTFDAAPTDWYIQSGDWAVTSRWPCTPGWAWFSGTSLKAALARTKQRYTGDQVVDFYAGAKDTKMGEAMRDIIVGLCGSNDPNQGYRFTIQSRRSGDTILTKNGKVVARTDSFQLSQHSIHFNWTSFSARKIGSKISLQWWGRTILEYNDPSPIEGGYVWLGTYHNAISIPRVTIYGKQG